MRHTVGSMLAPFVVFTALAAFAPRATAAQGITRIEITRVESPTFGGRTFGSVGAYEKLVGQAFGELDPSDPHNDEIVNIDRAPVNARGMVEYVADVHILKPVAMQRGNRTLLYHVVNRGGLGAATFLIGAGGGNDPTTADDAGDGLLMSEGYTLVRSGWQGDMTRGDGRISIDVPTARNADGSPIRRWIMTEYVVYEPEFSIPLSWDRGNRNIKPYLPVEESMSEARLYERTGPHAPAKLIPRDRWSFATCDQVGANARPSKVDVCLSSGFATDRIYQLVYEARDPLVNGIGFAATRDLVSFLRYDTTRDNPLVARSGTPDADAGSPIRHTLAFGSSQSGRFLKDLIYQGFSQDVQGRVVFDGAIPHISGSRRTFINYEFSMPGRFSTWTEGHLTPGDDFPFTYETSTDPVTGGADGLLARCRAQYACPKIMHWDSGTEIRAARAALVVTDPLGKRDVEIPDNVRVYYFSGTQHGPTAQPERGFCQQLSNPLKYVETQRALLLALRRWVAEDVAPPPSRYPRISDGTLVPPMPQHGVGFPAIPGVRYSGRVNDKMLRDYTVQPPVELPGTEYTVLVPKVDADGNELAGVRAVDLQAPLATYAGWNLRREGFMENEGCYLVGSHIPFARTRAERGDDPRLSLEERYGTHARYAARVREAAQRLQQEGFLLPPDAERLVREAEQRDLGLPR